MQAKRTILLLLLLGMVALSSCGLREKHVQGLVNKFVPAGIIKNLLQAGIHKVAKMQYGCPIIKDYCSFHCNDLEKHEGYCHGTKCKCNIPNQYELF
uniref:Neurotoxin KTx4 n=1 Tax=Lychas mucronatus TaxID=172552 RepID=A0A0U1SBW3_LYCMC|nr:neurotoxin KTx4 [Lychas mucronatus]